jgi:hypothetical protein
MKTKLLSINSDAKTRKGAKFGFRTGILYLTPGRSGADKIDLCPSASIECRGACLAFSGRAGIFPTIRQARDRRRAFFLNDRDGFFQQIKKEISSLIKSSGKRGETPVIRLNGTSDILWENVREAETGKNIFEIFPDTQFYDYSKIPGRKSTYKNYHLTFSWSGSNAQESAQALENGLNLAIPFAVKRGGALPKTHQIGGKTYQVKDGDISDLRFLDTGKPSIIGLRIKPNKGSKKQLASGRGSFIIQPLTIKPKKSPAMA